MEARARLSSNNLKSYKLTLKTRQALTIEAEKDRVVAPPPLSLSPFLPSVLPPSCLVGCVAELAGLRGQVLTSPLSFSVCCY